MSITDKLTSVVVPAWARWIALLALMCSAYGLGRLHEARHDADRRAEEATKSAAHVVTVVKKEVEVVTKTEMVYRDRIKKIYVQGETLEKQIPIYVNAADTARFAVNRGFVRVLDAAWFGAAPGPAEDTDREPADVPLDVVAEHEVGNATSCRVWREQALGWRQFYAEQQIAINGKAGDWYKPEER